MKKILMTLAASFMIAAGASAQVYIGGGVGVRSADPDGGETVTTYKFVPEIGYNLNQDWAIGMAFGVTGQNKGGAKNIAFNPYARYTFVHSKYVNVFVDGTIGYDHTYNAGHDDDNFQIGFKPGVAVNLNKHFSFVTHIGFIGWEQNKNNNNNYKVSKTTIDLDGTNILFGLNYKF